MKDEKREQMRKFLQGCVDRDLAHEGEDAIESWLEKVERDDGYFDIYKLSAADKQQIKAIAAEFFAAREQEETDREKRRLAGTRVATSKSRRARVQARKKRMTRQRPTLTNPNRACPPRSKAARRRLRRFTS